MCFNDGPIKYHREQADMTCICLVTKTWFPYKSPRSHEEVMIARIEQCLIRAIVGDHDRRGRVDRPHNFPHRFYKIARIACALFRAMGAIIWKPGLRGDNEKNNFLFNI